MTVLAKKQQTVRNLALIVLILLIFSLWLLLKQWQFAESWSNYLLFALGYLIGIALMVGDEKFFYRWYNDSEHFLVTRSPMFMFCLPLLSIFVFTSTGSIIGMAMILVINALLCLEFWLLADDYNLLNRHFNWRLKENFPAKKLNLLRASVFGYFLFLVVSCF